MTSHDRRVGLRFGATCVVLLLWSGMAEPGLRSAFLAGLFLFASLVAAAIAVLHREALGERLTRWDEALAYLGMSLVFKMLAHALGFDGAPGAV